MDNIVVANKTTSEITTNAWGDVQLSQTSVVQMPVPPSEVAAVSRNGQNLTVTLKSGERVTVNNFFNADPNGVGSDMVFQNQDGTLWQARYSTEAFNGFTFEEISSLDSLLATAGVVGSATPEWAFAGLGLLGAGGAAAASGAGGGGGGGGGGAAADVSAPTAPSNITLSADGLTVRGIGEPGATINVRDVRGNVLGSAVVPADGNFTVPLNAPQLSGESLIVDQTDAAGNVSPTTPIATPDSTAPVGPANLTVSADGRTLTGTGEAGATVTVRDANGTVLGSAVVAADGTFTVPLGTPQVTGAPLTVDQTDAAGNVSASTAVATPDSTAPGAPGALLFNADGSLLTGTAEPGATVQLRAADGTLLGSAVAAADGTFSLTISPAQDNGQTLVVSAIDAAGNASATSPVTAPDITPPSPLDVTPPAAPTNVVISGDGSRISGRGEVGATVTILDAAGLVVATASVDADGTFNVPLIPAQTNGQALTVNLTDAAGNVSGNVAIGAPDLSQPAPPANLIVTPDGLTMTGTARAGFRIFVRSLSGRVIGVSRVAADGTFVVALAPGQVDGERLEVTAVDASGNSSAPMMVTAPDTTLPPPVTDLVVSPDGATLAGKGEAGDTVTVRDVNGALIATGTVAVNGTFIITLVPAVAQGVVLGVTQADAAGNVSAGTDVTVPDGTGPLAPVNPVLSADGTVVTGSGRPGDTIEVRDASGNVLGSAVVGLDGTYSVTLSSPQLDGQVLDVVAVAPNGVESVPTSLPTPDLTAPDQPTDLAVNPNGQLVTGRGEPGATVTVRDANGNVLGTALVGTTGAFAVPLPTAQVDGQALQVTLTDAAGNTSTPLPVSAPDLDGPLLPGNIAVTVDGTVLTGNGESGSTVTVTSSTGVVLGTAVVGADGVFSVALNSAQNNGQTLLVSATDTDGNASAQVPFITPDTQVPVPVTDLTFDATGDVLSGTGEPGATVTVRDASGTVIGSVVVDPDGNFSVALSTTQDNAQVLQVVQADARGNLSTAVNTTAPDLTDPAALTNVAISANGASVSGNGEIGATVTVLDSQGNPIGSAVVGANARFEITLTPAQNNGQTLSISQADAALNATPAVALLAPDILPPGAPTSVVSVDGVTVTGIGEEGATVTVRDANGTVLGSALAGTGGVFSITLVPGQSDGERLNVSQVDGAGNQSVVVGFNAIDTTPPAAPGALAITTNGALLTGTGEPGSTVTVIDANSTPVGTGVVGSDGTFTIALTPPQLTGQQLSVTLADASTNPSGASTILSPDFTAPGAPFNLDVINLGTRLTGNAEANTEVTVSDANGIVLGTATVDGNGDFFFVLGTPLLNGELLSLVITDARGNASQPLTYAAPDTTAPADVANLVVSPDGLTLSGTGEAGTTVTITRVDGTVLGRGPIDANGVFVVTLFPAAVTADILTVIATDGAGLTSNPVDIVGPDGTGLPAPTALALTPDGFTLTGTSVIGATITVLGTGNVALGTATVGSDGTFSVLLQSPQLNAQILHVTASNATGTSVAATFTAGDSTAPDAPTNLLISSDGSALSGRGEVGATVTVRNADGTLLGVAVVDGAGVFSVPLVPAQLNAQALTVAQTDPGLNLSQPATIVAPDLVSPAAPTGLSINTIGTVVSGQGEAGATVTVRDATGTVLATGVVDQSGNFQVTLPIAQLTGAALQVQLADVANNLSPLTNLATLDRTPPAAVTTLTISADGTTVAGLGEPNATVNVRDASGVLLGTAVVGVDGVFSVTLTPAPTNGETLEITQTDAGGNVSTDANLTAPDISPPATLTDVTINADGLTVTGRGEPGATVYVRDAAGVELGSALVVGNGTFTVTLTSVQINAQVLTVNQEDPPGNEGPAVNITAPDFTAPVGPSDLVLNASGLQLTGSGEAGSTVTATDAQGRVLGTALVADNSTFLLTLNTAQLNGQLLSVSAADPAGNLSPVVPFTVPDVTPPVPVTNLAVAANGTVLTGLGEAGATVNVTSVLGVVVGTGTVAANGTFSVTLAPGIVAGDRLSVVQIDAATNASTATSILAPGALAPNAPTNLLLSPDGLTLTGVAQAGTLVTVNSVAGVPLGTALVGLDGTFSVTLIPAQINGETLLASAAFSDGINSLPTQIVAGDITPPAQLTDYHLTADGVTLTGRGEAGATVLVLGQGGAIVSTALVAADGTFTATLVPAQTSGQILSVNQTDAAGNESIAIDLPTPDLLAPVAPAGLSVNAPGTVLSGTGEAGATVTITNAAGTVVGSGLVRVDGSFQVVLNPLQANGETLAVTLTDANGNVSPATNLISVDTTAPLSLTDVAIAGDGATINGRGEAGAIVSVLNAAGNVIGSGIVSSTGAFTVVLVVPLINAEVISLNQADVTGNVSPAVSLISPDLTPPAVLSGVDINGAGLVVTGFGEPGATVTVRDAAGVVLGTAQVLGNSSFSVTLSTPQINNQVLNVQQADPPGNVSAPVTVIAPDLTPPTVPTELIINASGTQVSGTGEAGTAFDITLVNGTSVGSGTVGTDGRFLVTLTTPQTNGQALLVVLTDAAGNASAAGNLLAPDTTPPAPVVLSAVDPIDATGSVVTGTGEAGARLTITNNLGNTVGTGTVASDGSFRVELTTPQRNGELLTVVQQDATGNPSPAVNVTAPDSTAPDSPVVSALTGDGLTLIGTGEPLATVNVYSSAAIPVLLGTAIVDPEGKFSIGLTPAQVNGEVLTLNQVDAGGNLSANLTYTVPDVSAPLPADTLTLSANGLVVEGSGEIGARVTVSGNGILPVEGFVGADGRFSIAISPAQLNGGQLNVTLTDAAGNVGNAAPLTVPDFTAPVVPTITGVDANVVTGTAEAGSTVTVYAANGAVLGSVIASGTTGLGTYSISLTTPQSNGEPLTVVSVDAANNGSVPLNFNAVDTTAPDAATAISISSNYSQLVGRGEAGATVRVYLDDGSPQGLLLGTAVVGVNGAFTVTLNPAAVGDDVLNVIQTDAALNVSDAAVFTAPLTPPPVAPVAVLSADGLTVTGTAVGNSLVTVYGQDGLSLGFITAAGDGSYIITLSAAQTNGEILEVTATTGGGTSVPTTLTALDTTAPAQLLTPIINATGTVVTGTGEVGATVTIRSADGTPLATALVGANGTFSVALNPAQANGEILSAVQTDAASNSSPPATINAPDITPPAAATALVLNPNGLQLSGSSLAAEVGATVTVRNAAGVQVGTGTVAADGSFSATLSPAQLDGQALTVNVRDVAGNVSLPTLINALDTTAPGAPAGLALSSNGLQLTGTGEAGATVTVTDAQGNPLGNALVGANGAFSVTLTAAQVNGQVLSVRQTDPSTNISVAGIVTAGDITAPLIATNLIVSGNGTTLSGQGEPNTTASVFGVNGEPLGTALVGSNGLFTVNLTTAQADGQALTVRLTDGANNMSASAGVIAPDITAPVAPVSGVVNASGTLVTGVGIAGDRIVVRSADGTSLGLAIVAANGTYSVALNPPQIDNQILSITQLDATGNVSVAIAATAPDLTPPPAANALLVSADGLTLSGSAEAGALVTVKNAAGVTLGTTTALGNGTFSLTLSSAQINGEVLTVTLADARGNQSPASSVTAPDIDVNLPVVASDNLATASVTLVPVTASRTYTDSFLTVLGLGGLSKAFNFTVNSGETAHSTLTLTSGNVLQLSSQMTYTLQVKDASGAWVTLAVGGSGAAINLTLLNGNTTLVIDMGTQVAGEYRLVSTSANLTLLELVNSSLRLDVTSLTQFNAVAGAAITGNVITDLGTDGTRDITGPDNGAVLQVLKSGSYVNAAGGTVVQGLYGTLTIDASGNYSYTPTGTAGSVGKVDVFNYQLVHPNGLSDGATLYVRIDSPQAAEVWSGVNLAAPALVVDATNDLASTNVSLSNLVTTTNTTLGTAGAVLGGVSGAYTFSVAADTVSDLTVTVSSSNLANLLGSLNVGLYKLNTATGNYVLVKSWAGGSLLALGTGTYGATVDDQTPGTYRVNVNVGGVPLLTSVTTGVINTATYNNQFVVSGNTPVAGNLFTDTAGGGADVLGSAFTSLAVLASGAYVLPGYNGASVAGTYGTLLVQADGSYGYTLKPGLTDAAVGQSDVFTYQLTHPNGTVDTATLTIDLQPNTGAVARIASFNLADDSDTSSLLSSQAAGASHDVIQGTDGNDTLDGSHGGAITLDGGAGNDTLIIVDQQFASVDGGTGTDTLLWAGGDASIDLGNLQARLHNIDVIDLNDTSAVHLTLNLSDLVSITDTDNSTLLIKGTQQDSVHMTGEWAADGTHLAAGLEYTQYTPQEDPTHHLWVQNGVQVV